MAGKNNYNTTSRYNTANSRRTGVSGDRAYSNTGRKNTATSSSYSRGYDDYDSNGSLYENDRYSSSYGRDYELYGSYGSGYGSRYASGGSSYGSGNYSSYDNGDYGSSYGRNYTDSYSSRYNDGYGSSYSSRYSDNYGSSYSSRYSDNYGSSYSSRYSDNYGNSGSSRYSDNYGSSYSSRYSDNYGSSYSSRYTDAYGGSYSNGYDDYSDYGRGYSSYSGQYSDIYNSSRYDGYGGYGGYDGGYSEYYGGYGSQTGRTSSSRSTGTASGMSRSNGSKSTSNKSTSNKKKKTGLFGLGKSKKTQTKKNTSGKTQTSRNGTSSSGMRSTGYRSPYSGSSYGGTSYGTRGYTGYDPYGYGGTSRSSGSTYSGYGSLGNSGRNQQPGNKKDSNKKPGKKKDNGKKKRNGNAVAEFALGGMVSILRSVVGNSGKGVDLKRNRMAFGVYVFIAVLIAVYLAGYTIVFLSRNSVNYDIISYGSVDTPTSYTGVIVRDEEVYTTPASGVISYEVTDNDRVKKGTAVCTVKDEESVLSMEENLDEINEKIFNMQQEREDISIYSEDIAKANEQIKLLVDSAAFDFAGGDISSIYELRNNVQKKLDNRNQMLLTENKGALTELVSQREAAESEIAKNTTTITANEGGVVSYYTDGLEATYKTDTIEDLTKEQTEEKDKTESGFRNSVNENDPVFKLVTSNMWYIAAYMPNEEVADWEEGDHKNLYAKDSAGEEYVLDAIVDSLVDKGVEKLVVLKVTKDMESFINSRSISFETSMPKTGYKVANSAIVEETSLQIPADYIEGDNIVYKVENGTAQKTEINISGRDDEAGVVYITLNLNQLIVGDVLQKPDDSTQKYTISDTMTIKGIFVMNSGIAEFKKINTENALSNSTHTVLDVALNKNIQIYDRVITDTSNIQKQQKVYS